MAKKLEGNGIWESSRMVLPEHARRIVQHGEINKQGGPRHRPMLDDQEQALISVKLSLSRTKGNEVTVHVWDRDEPLVGTVTRYDQYHKRITIAGATIPVDDVVKVDGYNPDIRYFR